MAGERKNYFRLKKSKHHPGLQGLSIYNTLQMNPVSLKISCELFINITFKQNLCTANEMWRTERYLGSSLIHSGLSDLR